MLNVRKQPTEKVDSDFLSTVDTPSPRRGEDLHPVVAQGGRIAPDRPVVRLVDHRDPGLGHPAVQDVPPVAGTFQPAGHHLRGRFLPCRDILRRRPVVIALPRDPAGPTGTASGMSDIGPYSLAASCVSAAAEVSGTWTSSPATCAT